MSDPSPYASDPSPDAGFAGPVDPYAPPKASITPGVTDDLVEAELTRRQLIKHETSVRSIGILYLFGAFFMGLAAVSMLGLSLSSASVDGGFSVGLGLFYLLLAALSLYLGLGLRRLQPKVRTGVTILSGFGLLGFPLGTLINGYILYLIHSEKGKRVMSAEYQTIIAQTPHVKYSTPLWLIILALLIISLFVFLMFMAFSS